MARARLVGTGLALAALLLGGGLAPRGARADIPGVIHNPANGHYYKWVGGVTTWMNGKAGAEALGGYLATATSSAEQAFLVQSVIPAGNTSCLGGTDEGVENTWTWITGEPWVYTNWNGGEPNNVNNEDYLAITTSAGGGWNDVVGNTGGMSGYVVEWNADPNIPPLPDAPTALSASLGLDGEVDLAWTDNSTNEAAFQLQRKIGTGNFSDIASPAAGVTVHADADVFPGTDYTYRVRAVNAGGPSAWSNEASVSIPQAASAPVAPSDPAVIAATATSITLGWTDNSDDETGFQVLRKNAAGAFPVVTTTAADATQWTNTGLAPDTTYSYRVRAVNGVGASGFVEIEAATAPTLTVTTVKGDLKDVPTTAKDSLKLQATFAYLGASDGSCDPVAEGLLLRVGPAGGQVGVQIVPAQSGEWKVSAKKATWKSPKGSFGKFKVDVFFATRLVKVTGSGLNLPTAAANPVRVSLVIGDDAGTEVGEWTEKKPGFLQLR